MDATIEKREHIVASRDRSTLDVDTSIKNEPQVDICVEATCNNPSGQCADAVVEVTFNHQSDDNALAELLNQRQAARLCPTYGRGRDPLSVKQRGHHGSDRPANRSPTLRGWEGHERGFGFNPRAHSAHPE